MASLNKVMIIGNLGKDPDTRYMPSGAAVCTFSVATNEKWKDKQTGEDREQVEWHRIVLFNRLAEIAAEYLKKGSSVFIEGKLQTRQWDDKNNPEVKHYTTEIVGRSMQMLGSKGGGDRTPHPAGDGASKSRPQASQQGAPAGTMTDPFGKGDGPAGEDAPPPDFDDDIPF